MVKGCRSSCVLSCEVCLASTSTTSVRKLTLVIWNVEKKNNITTWPFLSIWQNEEERMAVIESRKVLDLLQR